LVGLFLGRLWGTPPPQRGSPAVRAWTMPCKVLSQSAKLVVETQTDCPSYLHWPGNNPGLVCCGLGKGPGDGHCEVDEREGY
jgi:hypothetical protein